MTQYLLLKNISVQNANAITGLTYGFPAITHFVGFAHGLSRQLSVDNIRLGGVAVISHKHQVHVRQPKGWGDFVFALTRNPLTQKGQTAPINEEGRMSMQISLLIEVQGLISGDNKSEQQLLDEISHLMPTMRLAGGQISAIECCELLTGELSQQKALRRLMPGFVLRDRSDYLSRHYLNVRQQNPQANVFDAWCDFVKLRFQAQEYTDNQALLNELPNKVEWLHLAKPESGYLVPIASGYYAISPLYGAGEVANTRDNSMPATFAEVAYSLAEWQSVHRLKEIDEAIWRYTYDAPWYLVKSQCSDDLAIAPDDFAADDAAFDPDNF